MTAAIWRMSIFPRSSISRVVARFQAFRRLVPRDASSSSINAIGIEFSTIWRHVLMWDRAQPTTPGEISQDAFLQFL